MPREEFETVGKKEMGLHDLTSERDRVASLAAAINYHFLQRELLLLVIIHARRDGRRRPISLIRQIT